MPLQIIRNDITKMQVDCIVDPTDESLSGSGGLDARIHAAAGPELRRACDALGHCAPGEVVLTRGFALPCRHVIHTVGPKWQGGVAGEARTLASCYRRALHLAHSLEVGSIALPLIASGSFGFPKDLALQVATETIGQFLMEFDLDIFLVVFDPSAYQLSRDRYRDIAAFIDDAYVEAQAAPYRRNTLPRPAPCAMQSAVCRPTARPASLDEALKMIDESFSEMLLRKIDEKGMKDSQCYKKANIDRKLFSKIRSDRHYRPSKPTALAFAIALELPLEETRELLMKAGFALSRSNKFDIIVEYFIRNKNYNIFEINEALFAFDQSLLGG